MFLYLICLKSCSISDGEVKQHLISCVQLSALTSPQFCLITSELSAVCLTNTWLLHGLPTQLFTTKYVHTLTSHYWLASGHHGLLPECLCWILKQKRIQRRRWLTLTQKNPIISVATWLQFFVFVLVWRSKRAGPEKLKNTLNHGGLGFHRNEVIQTLYLCLPQLT